MKNAKRIASLLMALVMVVALAVSVSAAPLTEVPADTGSILIKDKEDGSVLASQKTFAAYRIMDLKAYADEDGNIVSYIYTVPENLVDFYVARYEELQLNPDATNFNTKVSEAIDAEEDMYAFARDVVAYGTAEGNENPLTAYSGSSAEGGYQFTDLPLGYYAVVDTTTDGEYVKPISAIILDTNVPDVEIEVKVDRPVINKKIDEDNDLNTTDDRVDTNEAAIGDTITYVIDSVVPDMTGFNKYFFIMKDTMSKGLTYTNNMVITVGDKTLVENTDYILTKTENEDGTTDLKIVFVNFLQYNKSEFIGEPVVVTYTANLNGDAVIYKDANTNEVYLEYSANPSVDYVGKNEPDYEGEDKDKEPLGETPVIKVETYTTALEVVKVDPQGNRLAGAEFTLSGSTMNIVRKETDTFVEDTEGTYWLLKDGSYTTTDPESTIDGEPVDQSVYADLTKKYSKTTNVELVETPENVIVTGTVGQDGILRLEGLKSGEYTISEIKAPDGYNILTDDLTVKITWNEDNTFSYTGAVDSNGIARITIVNQVGSELPSTGGIGTTVFYIVGGLMVLAAIVLLVTKKRMAVK